MALVSVHANSPNVGHCSVLSAFKSSLSCFKDAQISRQEATTMQTDTAHRVPCRRQIQWLNCKKLQGQII